MAYDVICVGSALLDIYLKSDKFLPEQSGQFIGGMALTQEYGGKTEVNEIEVTSGGAGTNTAVSFVRKGFSTALVAELGKDLVGATIKEEMVREGVELDLLVEEDGEETGVAAILVGADGGRSAAIYRGASKMLTKSDIKWEQMQAKWIYIGSLGGEMNLLEGLIGHAKHYGIQVAVNPGKQEIEQLPHWGGLELFRDVDLLLVNREEAHLMSAYDFNSEAGWKSETMLPGPKRVIITDGRNGGKYAEQGVVGFYQPIEVDTIEETGAGDAFGSGVVAGLLFGRSMSEAIEWGKQQAASVVQFMGAKKGLLTKDSLLSLSG